ncbi:uncharacterized protein F5891DRAFT_1207551, partial [Suillus fuscotomentosus]
IVKDCLRRSSSDNTDPDVIIVHTQRLYDVLQDLCEHKKSVGKTSRMQKMTLDPVASTSTSRKMAIKGDSAMMLQDASHNKQNTVISADTMHSLTLLPDYGGPIFRHRRASLHQLNIRDSTNNLITPDKWYSELRQGMLVLFAATMHGYIQKDPGQKGRKTWQLVAKSIKVIDRSNEVMEPR